MAAAMKIDFVPAPPDIALKEEEFGFKPHNTVKVRQPSTPAQHSHRVSVLAANNRFGLIAVGTDTGVKLYKLSDLANANAADQPKPVLDIQTGTAPQYVSFNCDGTLLSVYVEAEGGQSPQIFVYNILEQKPPACITSPTNEVFLLDLAWNPAAPALLSLVYSDMKVRLCKVEGGVANCAEVKLDYQATCLSWSPKGKQLAVGTLTGQIVRVDQTGKTTFTLPAAPSHSTLGLFGLFWQSTYTYLAAFGERTDIHNFSSPRELSFMTIRHGKDQPVIFSNYSDIWMSSGTARVNMMLSASIAPWDMLVTMVSNAMDAALVTYDKASSQWSLAALDDTVRISVPMTSDDGYAEHFALGLAVSFNSTSAVPLTETYTHPPCPVVCVLSTNGSLLLYNAINRLPGADHSLVKPPQPVNLPTSVISTSGTVPKSAAAGGAGQPPPYNPQGATSVFTMQPKSTQNAPAFGAAPALGGMSALTAKTGQGLGAASIFAAASQGATSTFGGASAQTASSLFGAAANKGAAGLFGAAASQSSVNTAGGKTGQTTSLFGAQSNQGSSAFGGKPSLGATSSFGAQPSAGFGDKAGLGSSSGFGALAAATAPPLDPRAEKAQPASQPQQLPKSVQPQQPSSQQQQQPPSQPQPPPQAHPPSQAQPPSQPQQPQQPEEELERLAAQERLAEEERKAQQQAELQRLEEEAARQEAEKVRLAEEKVRAAVELKRQTEAFYNSALEHETERFNKELDALRAYIERPIPEVINRGELREMRSTISDNEDFSSQIKENVQVASQEIHSLRLRTLDSLGHLNQMESLYHKSQDPQYRELVNARPLDPRLSKLKQSIEQRFQYLKQEVLATDTHLDELWLALHQDKPRKTAAEAAARTDVIYRTLATIERIIAAKRSEVDALARRLGQLDLKTSVLRSLDLNSSPAKGTRDVTSSAKPAVKKLSDEKAARLRDFLSSRGRVPIVKSAPVNLKAPTFDPETAARRIRQMNSKLSPVKAAQPSTSSKLGALPHRDIPRKVTQSQPSGLTQPIASRAEVKQPVKESGGVTKPVLSKISQPTPDLPTMPGVKSAFNVPADVGGYQAGFTPLSSQPSAASSFNKSTPSAGGSPNRSAGAKPPAVASGSKASLFTAVAPPADSKAAGISTTPVANSANKQPVARSLGEVLSSTLEKDVLDNDGDPDASTFPQGKSVPTPSTAAETATNKPGGGAFAFNQPKTSTSGSLFGGVKPVAGQQSAGGSLFSFTPKTGGASAAGLFTTPKGGTPTTSAAAGDGKQVTASPNSTAKGILGGAFPSATSVSNKSATPSVPTTAASASASTPTLGFAVKPSQPSSRPGSSLFTMTSGNEPVSGSFAFNSAAMTAAPTTTSAGLLGIKPSASSSVTATTTTAAVAASQLTSTTSAARSLFGSTTAASSSSSLASLLSTPLEVSATTSLSTASSTTSAASTQATLPTSSAVGGFAASFGNLPASTSAAATTAVASTAAASVATVTTTLGSSTSANASSLFGGIAASNQSSFGGKSTTPSASLFGVSTTSSSVFGGTAATTASSVFGAAVTTAPSAFGTAATTAPSAFGAAATTAPSVFGAAATTTTAIGGATATTASTTFSTTATTAPSVFGAAVTTAPSVFGGTAATTAPSVFGGTTATTAPSVFGATTATTAPSVFGATTATTAPSVFGATTATTAPSVFGAAATTAPSVFGGTTATTASSVFGGTTATTAPSVFGATTATTAPSVFGATTATTAPSVFGATTATTAPSVFGATTATTAPSVFGATTATTAPSVFGATTATTAPSVFGATTATTAPSVFGATTATPGSVFGGAAAATTSSAFGGAAPASSASSVFGTATTTTGSSLFTTKSTGFGSSVFGGTPATTTSSAFGSKPSTAFGGASSTSTNLFGGGGFGLGGTPDPEKAKQNPFGKSTGATAADSTAKNLFGNAKSSPFGTPAAATGFGGTATGSSPFGGATTSSSGAFGASPAASTGGFGTSSGFGTSTFGAKPAFGAAPSFGAAPALGQTSPFGAKPTFGSPAAFGSSPASSGFSQAKSVFGAAAQQDMPTFGSLAANPAQSGPFGQAQASPFGSPGFGQPQQQSSPFGAATSPPANSSFSSYRS